MGTKSKPGLIALALVAALAVAAPAAAQRMRGGLRITGTAQTVVVPPPPGGLWVVDSSPVALPVAFVTIAYTLPVGCTDIAFGVTPTGGCKVLVTGNGNNLQTSLDLARHGDIVQTACNTTFPGSFILPTKAGAGVVYWTSSCRAELPARNNGVNPNLGGSCGAVGALPCGVTANMETTEFPIIVAAGTTPHYVLEAAADADTGWRIEGQKFTTAAGVYASALMRTYSADGANVGFNIILNQNWITGDCTDTTGNIGVGISVVGAQHAVTWNYIDCMDLTDGESKGVLCASSCVVFALIGNLIHATGIAAYVDMTSNGVHASDVEVRHNFLSKPNARNTDAAFVTNKNGFEIKSGTRVLFEANIITNTWVRAQETAINIKIGDELPLKYTEDVTIRKNVVRDSSNGLKMCMQDCNTPPSLVGRDYAAYNNLFDNINGAAFGGDDQGHGMMLLHLIAGGGIMVVAHNTGITTGPCVGLTGAAASTSYSGLDFSDNICRAPVDFMRFTTADADAAWPSGYTYTRNLIADTTCANYPGGNQCPASYAAMDFINFNGGANGNYRLAGSSPYKGDGQDTYGVGTTDPGANIAVVEAATSCVLTRQCASTWYGGAPAPAPAPLPLVVAVPAALARAWGAPSRSDTRSHAVVVSSRPGGSPYGP
jgi:hypothetical protein